MGARGQLSEQGLARTRLWVLLLKADTYIISVRQTVKVFMW